MEIWKPVVGYEGLYEVSSLGVIRSLSRTFYTFRGGRITTKPKELKLFSDKGGYLFTCLSKEDKRKSLKAHRMVAMAFIPNPENKPAVNHKNGIKTDNSVENLEWVTNKENSLHATKMGLQKHRVGSGVHFARINESDVFLIKRMIKAGVRYKTISKIYDLSIPAVCLIYKGKTWKHVT